MGAGRQHLCWATAVAGIEAVAAGNEAAWYSGSIYGAVNASYKWNRDQEDQWLRGLERQHDPALRSLSQRPRGLVPVRIPF